MSEKQPTFEESLALLETIVKELEQGEVPLEKALEEFQTGINLSKNCQEMLTKAEDTLTKLMTEDDQEIVFEEGDSNK